MTLNARQFDPQYQQLSMFTTAREIHDHYGHTDYEAEDHDDVDHLYDRKAEEAENDGLYKSIVNNGVRSPVLIDHSISYDGDRPFLANGHHRAAVMHEHDPDALIPQIHEDDAAAWTRRNHPENNWMERQWGVS